MKGKLKRSLKEKCPDCGGVLSVRVSHKPSMLKGTVISIPVEYVACADCDYEHKLEQKRVRRDRDE